MKVEAFLGMDVSKGYVDCILLDADKQQFGKLLQVYDTLEGHQKLQAYLREQIQQHGIDTLYCGVESTGGYEDNWYNMLAGSDMKGLRVMRLNPRGVRHEKDAGMIRTVTDKVSARMIATHLINHKDQLLDSPEQSSLYRGARKYYKRIQEDIQHRTRQTNRLEKLIYQTHPELLKYCKNGIPNWVLELVYLYPSADKVARSHMSSLVRIKGVGENKLETVREKAKNSVAVRSDIFMEKAIQGLCKSIMRLGKEIKKAKKFLEDNFEDPMVDLLGQIKGIGKYSAIGVFMEIGDANKFEDAKKVASYFGVHCEYKQSGDGQWRSKMSKKGRASCRSILYMAARNLVNHNPYFKAIYAKHRKKGKCDASAIGVIMHKFLRVAYGMMKNGTAFDPKVDQANQQKQVEESKKQKNNNDQQHVEQILESAPISQRKAKKLKAMQESQSSNEELSTGSSASPLQT